VLFPLVSWESAFVITETVCRDLEMQYASGMIHIFSKHDRSLHKNRFTQLGLPLRPRLLWPTTKVSSLSRISPKYPAPRGCCFQRIDIIRRQEAIRKKSHDLGAYPTARFAYLCSAEYCTKVTSGSKILEQRKNRFFAITKPRWFEKKHIMFFPKSNYYI
jgi:hypothetical protein